MLSLVEHETFFYNLGARLHFLQLTFYLFKFYKFRIKQTYGSDSVVTVRCIRSLSQFLSIT